MKAITIKQPWAGLIMAGLKRVENRSWRTSHRGWLLIHVAGRVDEVGLSEEQRALPGVAEVETRERGGEHLGHIVGMVKLVDIKPGGLCEGDPFAVGPWCWVLGDVRVFDVPVPWCGRLSIYDVPDEVVAMQTARAG